MRSYCDDLQGFVRHEEQMELKLKTKTFKNPEAKNSFMHKKGFEVGISFFVTLVIALIVFGFAMSFAFKFFGKAKQYQKQLDQNTRAQLEALIINSAERVAVYPTQVELHGGETEIIGIGVLNILEPPPPERIFVIKVNCSKFIYTDGNAADDTIRDEECEKIKIVYLPDITLKTNANQIMSISIRNTGALRGTFILDAKVTTAGLTQVYGGIQKIYLKSL